MQWFYAKDGQQLGPVEFSEIERLQAAGDITGETLVWQQGTASWVKLSSLVAGAPAIPPIPGTPVTSSYAQPVPAIGAGQKTNTLAIISLVLGIIGLCCLLPAIGAVVCGHLGKSQLAKNPAETGAGLATAGLVLGYVGIALQVVLLIVNFSTIMAQAALQH